MKLIEFLRYLFLISILAGSTSIGFLLSRSYSNRVRELKAFSKLVNIVKSKIEFTQKPLAEIFEETYLVEKNLKISKIFYISAKKIESKNIKDAWNEAISEEKFFWDLKKEDIALIRTFGNMLGKTDVEGQVSEINQFKELLNSQISMAEEENSKSSKMYKSLGTIVGLGIIILLY